MSGCFPSGSLTFVPAGRGYIAPSPVGLSFGAFRLSTDPVGNHTLTLTNVVVGSRVAVRDQAGTTTFYDQIAAASTVVITLSAYSSGSALNDISIRVRKASSAPKYQPFETFATISIGASSIFIAQVADTIAS